MRRPFRQVDVFSEIPYCGNPVAVVHEAGGIGDDDLLRFARWTNLSETTFVLPPTDPEADYRVRIFTASGELPFAGHPTLGTCHAWLEAGGVSHDPEVVVQECPAGLIRVRRDGRRLAFAAPPLVRSGPADEALVDELATVLGLDRSRIEAVEWVDNGPGWVALLVDDLDVALAVRPAPSSRKIGIVARRRSGDEAAIEVRGLFPIDGVLHEDPVTGSLNASVAQWLLGSGRLTAPYVASQGTVLGRAGRVHVSIDDDGAIWVGGGTVTCITGTVELS
jgi:PhzF family phenazine biosynthesis protein